MRWRVFSVGMIAWAAGCSSNVDDAAERITDPMRQACPNLDDEALADLIRFTDQELGQGQTEEEIRQEWDDACTEGAEDPNTEFGCLFCGDAVFDELFGENGEDPVLEPSEEELARFTQPMRDACDDDEQAIVEALRWTDARLANDVTLEDALSQWSDGCAGLEDEEQTEFCETCGQTVITELYAQP